ncbi:MAG: NAD(P)-dependent alcohol dehydrogenase [Polyangiales bacterium]
MRRWEITSFGTLTCAEAPSAPLGPGEVRVRTRAVSLNYRDVMLLDGRYNPRLPLPAVPCSDVCGEVVEAAPDVTRVKVGDRVIGSFAQGWISGRLTRAHQLTALAMPLPGVLATERVFPQEGLVVPPASLDDAACATLPCAALTAWHALVDLGRLQPGETVLVQGAGGVSVFALLFAKSLGARVIATTSGPERAERLRALGAELVVNYREDPQWGRTVKKRTDGVDHVVEVGGAGTLTQSLIAVAPGGCVHVIGVLGGVSEPLNVLPVLMNEVRMQGVFVGPRDSLEAMGRHIDATGLRPVIDRVFGFDDAPAAFARMTSGDQFGKVVITAP